MKIINQSINNGISIAYISLLQDFSSLLSHTLYPHMDVIDTQLHTIIQDLEKTFLSLDTLIGGDITSRRDCISQLQSFQSILENRYRILNGYERELSHISLSLEEKYQLLTINSSDVQGIDYTQFIHEFLDFISSSQTDEEKKYKLAQTIGLVPIRMTKDSFISYIKRSLGKISVGHTDEHHNHFLSVFKQLFDGRYTPEYNNYFSDLNTSIEEFRKLSTTTLSSEDIEKTFDDIQLTKDHIDSLHELLNSLHFLTSRFSILFLMDDLDFPSLMDRHIAFKDFFFTLKSLLNKNSSMDDYEIILESLSNRLEEVYIDIDNDYKRITNELFAQVNNKKVPPNEEAVDGLKIDSLIRSYLLLDIKDIFSFNESKDKISTLPKEYIQSATDFLQKQFGKLKPAERKLRMQYLMSAMPFIMSEEQLFQYVTHGFEGTSNEIRKAYLLSKIGAVMDSCGYFEQQEQQAPNYDHIHSHDHNCHCHH